jgi:hypothetical protein
MKLVSVHFNLRTKLWSVTDLEGANKGKVTAHLENVYLINCRTKVSEAQRQWVIRNNTRQVHAKIVGNLSAEIPSDLSAYKSFSYNPFKAPGFVCGASIFNTAKACAFVGKKALVLNPE